MEQKKATQNADDGDDLKLEILQYNYWEHFKFEKDLAMVLPLNHPKRTEARKHTSEILEQIHKLQSKNKKDGGKNI